MKELLIKTKKAIFASQTGLFGAPSGGEGFDFFELKEYDYQSDAKKIDWKSFAKTRKPYTKVFHEEKMRNIVLCYLPSGSLFFGSTRLKSETLLEAMALIGYAALKEQDNLTVLYENEAFTIDNLINFEKLLERMGSLRLVGKRMEANVQMLFHLIPQRSFVVFFGDFLTPIDLRLFGVRHEVLAVVARDSFERSDLDLECEAIDNESLQKRTLFCNPRRNSHYAKKIDAAITANKRANPMVDFLEIYDTEDTFLKLQYHFWSR